MSRFKQRLFIIYLFLMMVYMVLLLLADHGLVNIDIDTVRLTGSILMLIYLLAMNVAELIKNTKEAKEEEGQQNEVMEETE